MNLDEMSLTLEQRAAIECVDRPLLLCAGAGSGKTFTLQQRIAYALSPESGPAVGHVHEIMAITFTEKAAEEIKSRVRAVLRSENMMDQALQVDSAWISTIHGMAARILKEFALEFDLDPEISQIDDVKRREMRGEALSAVLERASHDPDDPYRALLREYGVGAMSSSSAPSLMERLTQEADVLPLRLEAVDFHDRDLPGPRRALEGLAASLEIACEGDLSDKQAEKLEIARDAVAAFMARDDADVHDAVDLLAGLALPSATGGAKELITEIKAALGKAMLETELACGLPAAESLLRLALETEAEYTRLKREAGVMDISDLLHLAYSSLRARPDIAARLRKRFKLIMVDEFQDTNRLQIDLIKLICEDRLGDLCTVGDAQQSIYRFQGADVNVYMGHKREMQGAEVGALPLTLGTNFRSNADILAFVRKVCGVPGYFSEPFLDLEAGRDEARVLRSGRGYRGTAPRIHVALTAYRQKTAKAPGVKVSEAKAVEAELIAQWFSELREAGHSPSEMVILLGTTTHAAVYADALRNHGFSCVMAGGSGFYARPEVGYIVNLVKALAEPADTQALFAVLSGEMITLSADDFIILSTLQESPEAETLTVPRRCALNFKMFPRSVEEGSPRLRHAAKLLHGAWERVGRDRIGDIVRDLLTQSGYLARLEDDGAEGAATAANILKAVRIIEEQEDAGLDAVTLAAYLEALSEGKEKMGSLMGDVSGSVRIMTAHSSKGLEFPFVAVADCYAAGTDGGVMSTLTSEGDLYVSLAPTSLSGLSSKTKPYFEEVSACLSPLLERAAEEGRPFDIHSYIEEAQSLAEFNARMKAIRTAEELFERRRLFYVAATRASEAMFIAMTARRTDKGISLSGVQNDIVDALFGDRESLCEDALVDYGGSEPLRYICRDANEELQTAADSGASHTAVSENAKRVVHHAIVQAPAYTVGSLAKRSDRLVSYSSLARSGESGESDQAAAGRFLLEAAASNGSDVEATSRIERGADADKATDFGSAFHRLAQLAVLRGVDAARGAVERQARHHGVADVRRLRSAFETWVASDPFSRVCAMPLRLPEYPFAIELGDNVLQGYIDLLCIEADEAFVIDYKTGGSPDEDPQTLYRKHLLQAESYAYALLGLGYRRVELVFVRVEMTDDAGAPQCVVYSFDEGDAAAIKENLLTYS